MMPAFDILDLDDESRQLIAEACDHAPRIYLRPLDKGLSGADVWLAQWYVREPDWPSALHVFKIGDTEKLKREKVAVNTIVSAIEPEFPNVVLYERPEKSLLRQPFMGGSPERVKSFRKAIQEEQTLDGATRLVQQLYMQRMAKWHPPRSDGYPHIGETGLRVGEALDWWVKRKNLDRAFEDVGRVGLERRLFQQFGLTVDQLRDGVDRILQQTVNAEIGPVHGDLHAQNVLVDNNGNLHLIDFGWTNHKWRAVDFLMMECSIKFVVSPPYADLDDLLAMERLLDRYVGREGQIDASSLHEVVYGAKLSVIARAVAETRLCARALRATVSFNDYRRGLIALQAGLASLEGEINRAFLLYSLAYHLTQHEAVEAK